MKATDIKVGGVYLAKVNGTIARVRVDSIDVREGRSYTTALGTRGSVRGSTSYQVTNLRTGRRTTFRSAVKLRCEAPAN